MRVFGLKGPTTGKGHRNDINRLSHPPSQGTFDLFKYYEAVPCNTNVEEIVGSPYMSNLIDVKFGTILKCLRMITL